MDAGQYGHGRDERVDPPQRSQDGRPPKMAEVVAHRLTTELIRDDVPAGTRLANERVMLLKSGVSRGTLREALRLLETRGVIYLKQGPGGGPVVRRPQPDDMAEALSLLLEFEGCSLAEVIDTRAILEPVASRRAAERVTGSQVDRLVHTVEAIRAAPTDREVFFSESQAFHRIVGELSGDRPLRICNRALHAIANAAVRDVPFEEARIQAVANDHEAVLRAIGEGDGPAAATAMEKHVRRSSEYWGRFLDLDSSPVRWLRLHDLRSPG